MRHWALYLYGRCWCTGLSQADAYALALVLNAEFPRAVTVAAHA
jgi:hypothetical protein